VRRSLPDLIASGCHRFAHGPKRLSGELPRVGDAPALPCARTGPQPPIHHRQAGRANGISNPSNGFEHIQSVTLADVAHPPRSNWIFR
jgi:hypothetical protein